MNQKDNLIKSQDEELIFKNVSFSWNGDNKNILNQCNFSIKAKGLWMIVGRNGCGKSTIFKLIKGILKPTKGYILAPKDTSLVFQNPDHQILMPTCGSELILNIKENLSRKDIAEKVSESLKSVGLDGFYKRPVHTLSGGQKQRLAIASALISGNQFILMDEPTALLDEISQSNILSIIKKLINKTLKPITVLWITHRLEELEYADYVASMNNGKLSSWQKPSKFKR